MTADEIRELLRDWIRERGTQGEIAERMGSTNASVSRWLGGQRPLPLKTLDKLLRAAQVDLLTLIREHSGNDGVTWQSVAVLPMRRVPSMNGDFADLVKLSEDSTKDRIVVPFNEAPALAVRLQTDLPQFNLHSGDVLGVVPLDDAATPGCPVMVQVRGRTEIGTYQISRGKPQVSVDGRVHEDDDYVMIGRVRGFWRDF